MFDFLINYWQTRASSIVFESIQKLIVGFETKITKKNQEILLMASIIYSKMFTLGSKLKNEKLK